MCATCALGEAENLFVPSSPQKVQNSVINAAELRDTPVLAKTMVAESLERTAQVSSEMSEGKEEVMICRKPSHAEALEEEYLQENTMLMGARR